MILYHLLKGTLRTNALKRELGDCSQRLLIKQLRELEEDGLVERKVFAVIPAQGRVFDQRRGPDVGTDPARLARLGTRIVDPPQPGCPRRPPVGKRHGSVICRVSLLGFRICLLSPHDRNWRANLPWRMFEIRWVAFAT